MFNYIDIFFIIQSILEDLLVLLIEFHFLQIGLQNQLKNNQFREVERMGSVSCPSCGSTIVGAGEALCALTHSNANLYDDSFTTNFNDAPDEVKSFRNKGCSTPVAASSPITSPSIKAFLKYIFIFLILA